MRTEFVAAVAAVRLVSSALGARNAREAENMSMTNPEPFVVPAVQQWIGGEGVLELANAVLVVREPADALAPAARLLADDLDRLGFEKPSRRAELPANGTPYFLLETGDRSIANPRILAAEAYTLDIGARGVTLQAPTPDGVFYATRTLLQMLLAADRKAPVLPRGTIVDGPLYQRRMLMIDVGRKPFPLDVLKDYLRVLSWFKMNELHLHLSDEAFGGGYTGFRVASATFPGLASKDLHYTKEELRELQRMARERGIAITPEIDMPGHARVFTDYWPDLRLSGQSPSYLDVTNPNTIARMKILLDEMIPVFDAPDFHIGTDEYRVSGPAGEKARLHEAFRRFINTMNAHVRSHGKNTRIWSGFEHMRGVTEIDPTVIIDLWETDDARGHIGKGHKVINSNHGRTYIVPGCAYYGVNNPDIYNNWEPWMVSGNPEKNPAPDDPHLLGGKLHIWNDQGPTGYTLTEIALLARPSLMVFAEKMWGRKGSPDYGAFTPRAAAVETVPGVGVFDRLPADADGVVMDVERKFTLAGPTAVVEFRATATGRRDLEWPWTLMLEVNQTTNGAGRGVILSSDLAEVCANYTWEERRKKNDPAERKKIREKTRRRGIGFVRAAGSPGATPAESHLAQDVSRVYADPLPTNEWVNLTFVGLRNRTQLYINGELAGEHPKQMLCPLARLGGGNGQSFLGSIRKLKVYNRALSPEEIGIGVSPRINI